MTELWSIIESSAQIDDESNKIKQAAKSKFNDGIFRLKQLNNNSEAAFFEDKMKKFEKNVKEKKKQELLIGLAAFVGLILIVIFGKACS
jgi:hypothetical protein